ncbi:hypothetical protein [Nocardioides sp. P5_E3]
MTLFNIIDAEAPGSPEWTWADRLSAPIELNPGRVPSPGLRDILRSEELDVASVMFLVLALLFSNSQLGRCRHERAQIEQNCRDLDAIFEMIGTAMRGAPEVWETVLGVAAHLIRRAQTVDADADADAVTCRTGWARGAAHMAEPRPVRSRNVDALLDYLQDPGAPAETVIAPDRVSVRVVAATCAAALDIMTHELGTTTSDVFWCELESLVDAPALPAIAPIPVLPHSCG